MTVQPVFLATWKFGLAASRAGWRRLADGASALDAIEAGANITELDPEVTSVGYGGLPNADGIVELDAAIMEGRTHSAGAVAGVTTTRRPISLARRVMERTSHVMLAGPNAEHFALREGFPVEDLLTDTARKQWEQWQKRRQEAEVAHFDVHADNRPTPESHDTIGLCALDANGDLAVGCTTSGLAWKLPGRVGDSPIIGAGLYVDNTIGAAAATGNGDEMMKAGLTLQTVLGMAQGLEPQQACIAALRYLIARRPPEAHNHYGAAIIALRKDGIYGAAATHSGFRDPDRLWQWAAADSAEPVLNEGVYVTRDSLVRRLLP